MSSIKRKVSVGNPNQNADCVVSLSPKRKGIKFQLESVVQNQFGSAIKASVMDELSKHQIKNVDVKIQDRGAVDAVLRARVECAIKRGIGE